MLDIFDILGPVMIGPSSSHTAGAARIGCMARSLLGAPPVRAAIHLYGSFAETGPGHGTDRALVGGLLGMKPDDPRLPFAFDEAKRRGCPTPSTRSICGMPTPTPPSSRRGPPTARRW